MDLGSRLSIYEYAYFLEYLPWSMNPGGKTCLVIGLGAGLVPAWYEQMGVRTDVVDIDPGVIALAREHFGLAVSGEVVADDARHYLAATPRTWDYVILDAFNGDGSPGHLVSLEALRILSQRLTPRGILAVNLIGSAGGEGSLAASVVRTLRQVFPRVSIHPVFDPDGWSGLGNFAIVATRDPSLAPDPSRVRDFPYHRRAEGAAELLFRTWEFPADTPSLVLTDDHNPADVLDRPLREALRERVLAATQWDILL
jgi:spermidine synthase